MIYIFVHKQCPTGPYLRLNTGAFKIHFLVKSLESLTDFFRENPFAKLIASAVEKVQPDPWVFLLDIFFEANFSTVPLSRRKSSQ